MSTGTRRRSKDVLYKWWIIYWVMTTIGEVTTDPFADYEIRKEEHYEIAKSQKEALGLSRWLMKHGTAPFCKLTPIWQGRVK